MALKSQYAHILDAVALIVIVSLALCVPGNEPFRILADTLKVAANSPSTSRTLYAVNQSYDSRGSISIYDVDHGHSLLKTIPTVSNVADVTGVVASAVTGKLYVAYRTRSDVGMIYCLSIHEDAILWNRAIDPGVDRLSIHPRGRLLYVPSGEGSTAGYINVLDADTGDVARKVYFSNRLHDAQFPLSGPLFQGTKATDGSGRYLYLIDPTSYAVSRVGPYSDFLGPYAVDSISRHVVNVVNGLWGMQVADIKTGQIGSATIPDHPAEEPGFLHGIGWTPDESEVWQSSSKSDPHVYVWSMSDPMAPKLKDRLSLTSKRGAHWLTFDLRGDYAYVAPNKNSNDGTEIFDVRTRASVGLIGSSEDMIEIDFTDGKISGVGDQYGIGRAERD